MLPEVKDASSCKSDPRQLYVGGVPPEASLEDLKDYFGRFEGLLDCKMKYHERTSMRGSSDKFRGFAFVTFDSEEKAKQVLGRKNHLLRGKKVSWARTARSQAGNVQRRIAKNCRK